MLKSYSDEPGVSEASSASQDCGKQGTFIQRKLAHGTIKHACELKIIDQPKIENWQLSVN
jgi:hypothetical protein